MKGSRSVKTDPRNGGHELNVDPRKSSKIQIEYNVPFSKLNPRIEKENLNFVNSIQSTHVN